MSAVNLQIRSPKGVISLKGEVTSNDQVIKLLKILEQRTQIPVSKQQILSGYPPKAMNLSLEKTLEEQCISSGEQLILKECGTQSGIIKGFSDGPYIPPSESSGYFVRRKVPSDNSCLFHSMAYVLESKSRSMGPNLRKLCANIVAENPKIYTTAFLGMSNLHYVNWILHKDTWGGAIEISILSQHYKVEVIAFDTQTMRGDRYGEDQGYSRRAFIIYTGNHYDALALASFGGAPENEDQVMFNSRDKGVLEKAQNLVKEEHLKWVSSKNT